MCIHMHSPMTGEFTGKCNLKYYEISMWHIKWKGLSYWTLIWKKIYWNIIISRNIGNFVPVFKDESSVKSQFDNQYKSNF